MPLLRVLQSQSRLARAALRPLTVQILFFLPLHLPAAAVPVLLMGAPDQVAALAAAVAVVIPQAARAVQAPLVRATTVVPVAVMLVFTGPEAVVARVL